MNRRVILPLLMCAALAAPLAAQTRAMMDTTKSCMSPDTPLRDTTYRTAFAWSDSLDAGSAAVVTMRRQALYEAAKWLSIAAGPRRVAISIPPAWAEDTARYLGVQRAEISVMVHRDGSISDAALTVPSGTPAMDSILRVALAAMDSASKDRRAAAQSDSMRVSIIVGTDRWGSSAFAVAVMTVAIATLRPTQFVDVLPGQKLPHPKGSPQTGSVMAMFAVGRDGRAVPGSIRIIRASAKNLGEAATNVIPTWRFSPAEYDGCPIVWWVEQPFEFR